MRGLETKYENGGHQTTRHTDIATTTPTWPRGAELVKKDRFVFGQNKKLKGIGKVLPFQVCPESMSVLERI